MNRLGILTTLLLPVAIAACTIQIAPPVGTPVAPDVETNIRSSAKPEPSRKPKPNPSGSPEAPDVNVADAYVKKYEWPTAITPGVPFTLTVYYGLADPSWGFEKLTVEVDEPAKTISVKPTMSKAAPRPDRPGMIVPAVIVDKSAAIEVTIKTPGSYTVTSPRYLSTPPAATLEVGETEPRPLLTLVSSGGLCPQGTCSYAVELMSDGTYTVDNRGTEKRRGTVSAELLAALTLEMGRTDFAAVKAVPFTGTCPTALDGQETVYTFHTANGPQELPTCSYDLDFESPLFKAVQEIRKAVDGTP